MPVRRGDIYFVDRSPTKGREQAERRPVVVLSSDDITSLPLVVTVAVGTKGENIARDFRLNLRAPANATGLPREAACLGFQIRSVDPGRFAGMPAGRLTSPWLERLEDAARYCLKL
jgi:mRNA interferase MazF